MKQFCKQMQLREHVLSANAKALKKEKKKITKRLVNILTMVNTHLRRSRHKLETSDD